MRAAQQLLAGQTLVFRLLNAGIGPDSGVHHVVHREIIFERRLRRVHFNSLGLGNAREIANLLRQSFIAAFELDDSFLHARLIEFAASHFDWQLLVCCHAIARHTQNFFCTGFFLAHQFQRMAHFGQFEISRRSPHDDDVMHSIYLEFHVFRAVFRRALLAFQQRIENCFVVAHLKNSGRPAGNGRKP